MRVSILATCLDGFDSFTLSNPWSRPAATLGWGMKPSSLKARHRAARLGIPHLCLEDGFLRSWGLGVEGYQPHSLAVDMTGIYYDATRPSDLERLILDADFSPEELARAERCIALLREHRLSKYNHAPDRPLPPAQRPRVLVVDQTAGDASIHYGLADATRFERMLDDALSEHPDAEVLVKIHPDVVAGRKRGHLLQAANLHPRCRVIAEDINPWDLFDAVDTVHVVTSQLGFEALLAGCRVICHGMPFYAGWGLTEDRLDCSRRNQMRSLTQLFTAAYLRYCRYANPYTGEASTLEATIDLIADQKRRHAQLAGEWIGVGFSSWKRRFVGDFMGSRARLTHVTHAAATQSSPQARLLVWSSDHATRESLIQNGNRQPVWQMEDGFLRSVGLGVDLVRPLSLIIDSRGIHYDPRQASDLEHLLATTPFPPHLLDRARRLREHLVALGLTKYNVGRRGAGIDIPTDRKALLVIGQVESDASVRQAAPHIATNSELLRRVRAINPDAWILYKPHPDVVTGARVGQLDESSQQLYDCQVTDISITELLGEVDELHTMSSLAGFEALLRGQKVVTWGTPFYAGWGLTEDRGEPCSRRSRTLTLDELVAGCLILYPTYLEPSTRQIVNVETVVSWLVQRQRARQPLPLPQKLYRWYRNRFIGRH
ncbi:capsular polysaccharide biosynthesis protein [Halomonas mongoliensis]|uniref:capsular polysaccharide biosynthesis protein n=1 Tax=Halomonas mongoliensis TaxID=321265 RepID=UPI00403B0DDF